MTDKPELNSDSVISEGMLPPTNPGQKPLFVNPQAAASAPYVGAPEDNQKPTFDDELGAYPGALPEDRVPVPENISQIPRDVRTRWLEVARLNALGQTNNEICERLGYSVSRVSIILKFPVVQNEIHRYRNQLFEQDIVTAMKDMGPDGIRVINEMMNSSSEKLKDRVDTAKWLLEKLTGKPKQEVNVESNTLAMFMETLRQMQRTGESINAPAQRTGDVIDVTPTEDEISPSQPSKWANWTKNNL